MRARAFSILFIFISLLIGCTYKIKTVQFSDKAILKKNNLFYQLPKTMLTVSITYRVIEKTSVINGIADLPEISYLVKTSEIKPFVVNDPTQMYIAKGKNISHLFFLKENIDFQFNEKGIIQSVESTFEDKSLESVESTLKGVAAIVKSIALAGESTDPYLIDLRDKITKAYQNLIKAIDSNKENDIIKYKNQIKNYYESLKHYLENNKVITIESEKIYTYIIDPSSMQVDAKTNERSFIIQPLDVMPEVQIVIEPVVLVSNREKILKFGKLTKGETQIPGLIYTLPTSLKTSVLVSTLAGTNQTIFEGNIDYSQFGHLGVVPVSSKIFTSRKTNLEFNNMTGALTKYKTESGSSSENLGKSIESSANLLKSTLYEIEYTDKIDKLKKQKEIIDLKENLIIQPKNQVDSLKNVMELLKIQFDIKKLQNDINELEGDD